MTVNRNYNGKNVVIELTNEERNNAAMEYIRNILSSNMSTKDVENEILKLIKESLV